MNNKKTLDMLYKFDYMIRELQSEQKYMSESEYYEFIDVEEFKETFSDKGVILDIFDDTKFLVFEECEKPIIIRQYSCDCAEAFCDYLKEFKYDFIDDYYIQKIKNELKK